MLDMLDMLDMWYQTSGFPGQGLEYMNLLDSVGDFLLAGYWLFWNSTL